MYAANLVLPKEIQPIVWTKNSSYSIDFLTSKRSPILKFALLSKSCISKILLLPVQGETLFLNQDNLI
ncbi:hypothetical protein DLM76_19820 [Leptospira yasudae]|uniref:Uncharacterized protein n=1 Tax=Leptospira yasudae TaxID=2202201 RepID=A0ABX9LYV0_9LEPT|nr:hypothetical protein [Leptospira yasudae]RHX78093.1 hypothetical protein DLM77_18730 [Leptospira yasudae]RHX91068.1 hypothetical protein DLM76_19820 [Leptospira yasudae]TGK26233.1 hypothetical protein EHQ05_10705 [Leptospira yasudae]TGM08521.1 hypothetical protein EHQ86_02850 [Leptospira yasudae]